MERIPFDIIINNIIPYTYNIQPKLLLEDIKNYYTIKSNLMDDKYKTDVIKHEILAVFYDNKDALNIILKRHFQFIFKKYHHSFIYKYSQNTAFNILFGLFTKEERIQGLDYVINLLDEFILK